MKTKEEVQLEFLQECVRDYKIFIDTSSLLEDSANKFFQNVVPLLKREGKTIIVPLSVCLELEKFVQSPDYCRQRYPDNPNLNAQAIRAFKTVMNMRNANQVVVYGDVNDCRVADNAFLHVFTKFRVKDPEQKYGMLLITQDRALASAVMRLGKPDGVVHNLRKIRVQLIDEDGFLQQVYKKNKFAPTREPESGDIPLDERFAFAKEITQIEGSLPVTEIPGAGDTVTIELGGKTKQIRLLERLGGGGEGSVYKTSVDGLVAKIYEREKITRLRYEKLKLMLSKRIKYKGVCFPLAMILNQHKEFVGYLMREASGMELGKSVFMPMLLEKYFPDWNRTDTVQLCVTILEKLKYLHDRNVILGDINPRNILVVSPTEVYFVDTDSYQVEGFICPVGMPLFTAPELQNKRYGLRTPGNENFAVATLLFMIMHPGKSPYAMQDGGGIMENIIKGDFSYPLGERKTGKVPKGKWRYCWSHLPYAIKEKFYETFRCDGSLHDEDKRPGAGDWLILFEYYLHLLKSGKMVEQDEEALMIFPTRFKKDINKTYAKCKLCGEECEEERLQEGICQKCLHKGDTYYCEDCGCEMTYTNYQKLIKHARRHRFCRNCYEMRNTIFERRTCEDCGKMFEITLGEKKFYESVYRPLPTICKECRDKLKAARSNESPADKTDSSSDYDVIRSLFDTP